MNNLEWIAYAFIMPGLYMAGQLGKSIGWLLQFIGCIIFVILAIYFQIWGIVFANILFTFIGIKSFITQRRLERESL